MDRWRAAGLGIAIAAAALTGGAAASDPPLRAMRWLAPGTSIARAMGSKPAECLRPATSPDQAYLIELGRAAFRTSLLIGGQAARAGVSCESCHLNAHNNPDFQFPGVSGAPGTADVSSSLFSSHRGDDINDPTPIADLGGDKAKLQINQDPDNLTLDTFVHGLVTQEFDGPEPPQAIVDGLSAYLRAQDPKVCTSGQRTTITLTSIMADARRAATAGQAALAHGDKDSAILMTQATRSQLALIYERYDAPALSRDRQAVQTADLDLAAALDAIRTGQPDASDRLALWLVRSRNWEMTLARDQSKSLFAPARLARLKLDPAPAAN